MMAQSVEAPASFSVISSTISVTRWSGPPISPLDRTHNRCCPRRYNRQQRHCRRPALERMVVGWGRRCLRGAVVRGNREKEKEQEERLSTINSELPYIGD